MDAVNKQTKNNEPKLEQVKAQTTNKKKFRIDMSWKENRSALIGMIEWALFLILMAAARAWFTQK